MSIDRREFLKASALITAGAALHPERLIAGSASAVTKRTNALFFDKGDLPRMRKVTQHPHVKPFWDAMVNADLAADQKFLTDELKLDNHARDLLRARQILERSSFVYALTGDPKHRDTARHAIDRILEYKKWDYFLEAGEHTIGLQRAPETTIAMACAHDWMNDALSADLKKEMERQIAEKGAPACYRTLWGMRYPERVRGWGFDPESDYKYRFDLRRWPLILNSTNLKVIPIAGLGIAGCLLYDSHPQAPRWIDLALQSAQAFSTMFGPDGSYDEGAGYWGYTALHLTMFVELLYRVLGQDHRHIINFPGTVRYGLQMAMPTAGRPKDCVNFGDAWNLGDTSVAAWTARVHKDPLAQYVAANIGEAQSLFSIVWFDPALKSRDPSADLHDVRMSNDWVVSRTGWKEADSVVALRSGRSSNHEHADRNSVIFKAYGERLFHDPYKAAYSYTDPHWVLRLTSAHSALLINGAGHQYHDGHEGTNASWAEAEIVAYTADARHMIVTSDATEAYRLVEADVDLVRRTLVFLKPDVLMIADRVRMKSLAVPIQARFQVDNFDGKGSARVTERGFEILRPHASGKGWCAGSAGLDVRMGTIPLPAEHGVHDFVEVGAVPASDHRLITVCTAQQTGKQHGMIRIEREKEVWTIKGEHNGQAVNIRINMSNDLPEVMI
jgi:hypothetical protein